MRLSSGALVGHPLRSVLSMLGIAIGVAAVIMLTSLGEGTRKYMISQFSEFGTNVLSVQPGKRKTSGVPNAFAGTTRKLTIEDAESLKRIPIFETVVPVAVGQARVEGEGGAGVFVHGVTSDFPDVVKFTVRQGSFLPQEILDEVVRSPCATQLKRELFGEENALGEFVRIAGRGSV